MTGDPRLPRFGPADLDDDQRALYDTFVEGPRQGHSSFFAVADAEGVLSGPYRAMLLSPALGAPLERLGRAVRYEAVLDARVRELAILVVASCTRCAVEWQAHESLALSVGVPQRTVTTLKEGQPEFPDPVDAEIYAFTRDLVVDNAVSDTAYDAVWARYGSSGVFELVTTIGYYHVIAHVNNAFGLGGSR